MEANLSRMRIILLSYKRTKKEVWAVAGGELLTWRSPQCFISATSVSPDTFQVSERISYKRVCVKFQCVRTVRGGKAARVPRWSVSGSGVWLGLRRWRRLCCILRARRHTVSHRCASADEFWDSPDASRPSHSPQTAEEQRRKNSHVRSFQSNFFASLLSSKQRPQNEAAQLLKDKNSTNKLNCLKQ